MMIMLRGSYNTYSSLGYIQAMQRIQNQVSDRRTMKGDEDHLDAIGDSTRNRDS